MKTQTFRLPITTLPPVGRIREATPSGTLRVATQAGLFPPPKGDSRTLVSGFRVALTQEGCRVPSDQMSR